MIQWVAKVFDLDPEEIHGAPYNVLLSLANHADPDGWCWPGRKRIAHEAALRRIGTVTKALTWLEDNGYIERYVNAQPEYGDYRPPPNARSNLYRLVFDQMVEIPEEAGGTRNVHPDDQGGYTGDSAYTRNVQGGGTRNVHPGGTRGVYQNVNEPSDEPPAPSFISRSTQEGQPEPVDNSAPDGDEYHPPPSGRRTKEAGGWMEEWNERVRPAAAQGERGFMDRRSWPEITKRAAHEVRLIINERTETEARIAFGDAYKRLARQYAAEAEARNQPANSQQRDIPMIGRRI